MTQLLHEVSMTVAQQQIDIYAELTNDFNPIHVDPAFAATTPMGGVIAHGTLSINLIWQSVVKSLGAAAIEKALLDIQFLKPLYAGDTVTAGGQRNAECANQFDVWVKSADGSTLITGNISLPDQS